MSFWRKCSSCKKSIDFSTLYYVCNVSTCNRKRTGLIFCSVSCWDAHLPLMNHRESWAEERTSPTQEKWEKVLRGEEELEPRVRKPREEPKAETQKPATSTAPVVIRRPKKTEPSAAED